LAEQNKRSETGGEFSTNGGTINVHSGFWWGDMSKIDHLEDLVVDGKIILKWIFKAVKKGNGFDCYGL
jgi:hypothetical protein